MMTPKLRRLPPRSGVAVVEFALTFPLLILLVVGLIEFTRLHNLRHAADNAAYEAARHVIVPGANVAEATARANDLLARAGIRTASIKVTPATIAETTERVTVEVSVPLRGNSWLPPGLTANRTVKRQTSLMTERVPVIQARAMPVPPPPPAPPAPPKPPSPPGGSGGNNGNGSGGGGGGSPTPPPAPPAPSPPPKPAPPPPPRPAI